MSFVHDTDSIGSFTTISDTTPRTGAQNSADRGRNIRPMSARTGPGRGASQQSSIHSARKSARHSPSSRTPVGEKKGPERDFASSIGRLIKLRTCQQEVTCAEIGEGWSSRARFCISYRSWQLLGVARERSIPIWVSILGLQNMASRTRF